MGGAISIVIGEDHYTSYIDSVDAIDDLNTINVGDSCVLAFFLPSNDGRIVRISNVVGIFYTKHQTDSMGYSFNSPSCSSGTFSTA